MVHIDKHKPVYSIGIVSEMLGIKPRIIRYYEEMGLVSPRRTEGGRRLYSQADLEVLEYIRFLIEEEGVNVAGCRIILQYRRKFFELEKGREE
jgi:MerR family transcriptional regulator/heat shock protein HspR